MDPLCTCPQSALLKALDEALARFGESVKQVLYHYLEAKYGVKRAELLLPENLAKLADLIREIFGPASNILEKVVLDSLCSKLGIDRAALPKDFRGALVYIGKKHLADRLA
ncbi:MAG: DUF3227 domain-containing protein [Candidatus Nezhaarchaeota archaeon]|nr:DUF3227 domain-containing protein [Candidatus Nezhaarchaeota archaeon]